MPRPPAPAGYPPLTAPAISVENPFRYPSHQLERRRDSPSSTTPL